MTNENNQNKVLFICESYKYKPSPNGICVQNIAENMVKENHTVFVLTLYNDLGQPKYEVYNGVHIYRVNPGFIRKNLFATKGFMNRIFLKLSAINGLFYAKKYPLLSKKQVVNLYNKADELNRLNNFDYCVTVYQQIHPVLAGIELKKKYSSIKLVLYTLDAISGGWIPTIARSKDIPLKSLKMWEEYFFEYIDCMFAMESHKKYYAAPEYHRYKDLIEFVDIPMIAENCCCKDKKNSDQKVHLVYTGSMSVNTANPLYLLALLKHLPDYIVFDIYGRITTEVMIEIQKSSFLDKRIFLHGQLPHEKILAIQKQADVLLNFGNSNPNMIPCKIFEYISSVNKILSFTHSPNDSSLPYIKRYTRSLIVDENYDMLQDNAKSILDFINRDDKCNFSEIVGDFEKNTAEFFLRKLFSVDYRSK